MVLQAGPPPSHRGRGGGGRMVNTRGKALSSAWQENRGSQFFFIIESSFKFEKLRVHSIGIRNVFLDDFEREQSDF
jgi:hypothetical protein